jgi:hypothetical protein
MPPMIKDDLLVALSVVFIGHLIFELIVEAKSKTLLKRSFIGYFIFGWFMGYGFLLMIICYKLVALFKYILNGLWLGLNILSVSIVVILANILILFKKVIKGNRNES